MERQPIRRLDEIPKAEQVDMNNSPVTREEMQAAVDALKEVSPKKPRIKKAEKVSSDVVALNKKIAQGNEEVIRALHTENPEKDTQFD